MCVQLATPASRLPVLIFLGSWVSGTTRAVQTATAPEYSACKIWQEVLTGENLRYAPVVHGQIPGYPRWPHRLHRLVPRRPRPGDVRHPIGHTLDHPPAPR